MEFKIQQIDCRVYLKKSIPVQDTLMALSRMIDGAFSKNEYMLQFHNAVQIKFYSFSGFKEIEQDKIYKEDQVYTFSIRSCEKLLIDYLYQVLPDTDTRLMKGLKCRRFTVAKKPIRKLYSVTPAIMRVNDVYWRNTGDMETYMESIRNNAQAKYEIFTGNRIVSDVFVQAQIVNRKPIGSTYKKMNLLGDKLDILIADNAQAVDVAYFLLGSGIGEMNSRGFGFMNYKY